VTAINELLLEAVKKGRLNDVARYLQEGANAKDETGSTPLHAAVDLGHKDVAEMLIAKGADLNAKTHTGMTPLGSAVGWVRTDVAELLKKHGAVE